VYWTQADRTAGIPQRKFASSFHFIVIVGAVNAKAPPFNRENTGGVMALWSLMISNEQCFTNCSPGNDCPADRVVEGVSRLPKALQAAGIEVAAFCHNDSFLSKTRFLDHGFDAPAENNVFPFFVGAVRSFTPDLLIPGCESSVSFIHQIIHTGLSGGLNADWEDILMLARRSARQTEGVLTILSKHSTNEITIRHGLRVSRQSLISSGEHPRIAVQQYIHGITAMHVGISFAGEMMKSYTLHKIVCDPQPAGPGSVVRLIENDTQSAYRLEFNPRPVLPSHLGAWFTTRPLKQSSIAGP
jgi:hypothetical protein